MNRLMSHYHPNLQLSEHIVQVESAIKGLCIWHSEGLFSQRSIALLHKVIRLHDIGKATTAFQKYIENPSAYTDDPMEKAHTPMSTLLTLLLAKEEGWDVLETMILSSIILGHHGELPSLEKLREIGSGKIPKVLKRQINTLQITSLLQDCGIDISALNLATRPWSKVQLYLDEDVFPVFEGLSIQDAVAFRLKAQLLFSLLLEADKALLAVKEPQRYLHRESRDWEPKWVEQKIGRPKDAAVNEVRQSIRANMKRKLNEINEHNIFSLTLPTGSGKTLLAATWLLELRKRLGKNSKVVPKAIIVLPFLSVIDQTAKEYESLLKIGGQQVDGSWFLTSHSLSDRKYKKGLEEEAEYFFIDTWRTELVITTYDQFLMSLLDPRARYQMRFHNLCDALIVIDEVQALPCRLWRLLENVLKCLTEIGHTKVLLMSATLPPIIAEAKPLVEEYSSYFEKFNRYNLLFRLQKKIKISDFCDEVLSRRDEWLQKNRRTLITLNTRKSARLVRNKLAEGWPEGFSNIPLFFLSADVTPKDRLETIEKIKEGQPCIVVSTQCIEAGVDIDMDFVIRDFAPFDSIVQIAGRCNREGNMSHPAEVTVLDLINDQGRRYSEMIYDDVHLNVTRQLVKGDTEVEEKDVFPMANQYFKMLSEKKDTGIKHFERFARWQEDEPLRELLRGKERKKYTFLVLEQDPDLKKAMVDANAIEDRWKRREAWRAIAGRIARISIDVYAKPGFDPQDIATEYLGQWLLRDRFYSTERGLILDDNSDNGVLIL